MPYVHIAPSAVGPTTAAGGTTQQRYRRLLAEQLGFWAEVVLTETATTGDPERIVLADEIRDDEAGLAWLGSQSADSDPYGAWLYVRTGSRAGSQRRIISDPGAGYLGNLGAFTLSRPFPSPLEAGTVVEVSSPLPCRSLLSVKGLDTLIDEALARCWIEAQITFTGNGTDQHDLSEYPYLELPERQTRGISDTRWGSTSSAPDRSPGRHRFIVNGATRTLVTETTYGTSETFTLDVVVRGDVLVSDGTAWSYPTTPGLAGDSWFAACPERWVVTIGMVKGLQELSKLVRADVRTDRAEKQARLADLARRMVPWAAAARSIRQYEMPKTGAVSGAVFAVIPSAVAV